MNNNILWILTGAQGVDIIQGDPVENRLIIFSYEMTTVYRDSVRCLRPRGQI